MGMTVYIMIVWMGLTENLQDLLLVIVAFTGSINATGTGFLIDMHII
jgi:hypothetical protein